MEYSIDTPKPDYDPRAEKPKKKESPLSTLFIVVSALGLSVLITMFVFRSYQVDGPSMLTTLHHNDRLIIWKLPKTISKVTGNSYIPNRGDIIVFGETGLATPDGNTKELIKRVIGLPGDRVVVKDGKVTVYNNENPDGFSPDTSLPYGNGVDLSIDKEENVDQKVGTDQVFAMGDNRNNSLDSRAFGPVDASDIVGKLVLRVYPLGDAKAF